MTPDFQAGVLRMNTKDQAPVTEGQDTSKFVEVRFPRPFPEGATIGVIPMVQTFVGTDSPGVRIGKVDHRGFHITMNETVWHEDGVKKTSDGNHLNEQIAWLAFTI